MKPIGEKKSGSFVEIRRYGNGPEGENTRTNTFHFDGMLEPKNTARVI